MHIQGFSPPYNADNAAFGRLTRWSTQLMTLLLYQGLYRGYLPETNKSLFISDLPAQEAAARREFESEGMDLKFAAGSQYL